MPRGYLTHSHSCDRCETARIQCRSIPERDEDGGGHCPGDAHPEQYVCEDCMDLERCEYCGIWLERKDLKELGQDLLCNECYEMAMADDHDNDEGGGER